MRAEVFVPILKTPKRVYINKRPPSLAVVGSEREGIAAGKWAEEAVYTNEKNSPRIEIPRVIVKTMRLVNFEHLTGTDLAVYWFLFANARQQGIHRERHAVTLGTIAKFLGVRHLSRIQASLDRLGGADVRYDCNQDGTRKQTSKLIDIAEPDRDVPVKARNLVHFELPVVLRRAVMKSKDYALVDINALPRLRSRYAVTLFIRLCYLAGMNDVARPSWNVDVAKLAAQLSFPTKGFRKLHLTKAVALAIDEINGLSKLHRRFQFDVIAPDEYSAEYMITVGGSARRVAEVSPAEIPDDEYEAIYKRYVLPLEDHQYPSVTLLRRAATLIEKPAKLISHEWRTDVWGATHHDASVGGMDGSTFLKALHDKGVEDMFDWWIDRLVFAPNGLRVRHGLERPPFVPTRAAAPAAPDIIEPETVEEESVPDDDVTMAADYESLEYGDVEAPALVEAEDIDDADIPF